MRLCHNSFIVHYGHGNGRNSYIWEQTFSVTSEKFREKWGFDMSYYTYSRKELIAMISSRKRAEYACWKWDADAVQRLRILRMSGRKRR